MPGGDAADGVVDGGSVVGTTMTLTRTVGGDVTITGLPSFSIHDLPQQGQLLASNDRIPIGDESAAGDPNEYMTAFNFFSSLRDVITTSRSNPLDNDRLYVTREDAAGDPLGYITVAQLQTRIGTPFDLHDDVSSVLVVLDSADRVLVSDESESGDPNEYMTARNFFNGLRDVTNNDLDHNAVPNDSDRLFISDESVSADPVEYITVAELRTAIGGGGTTLSIAGLPEESSSDLADVDIMVIENVSESNVQRHLTMGSLSAFLADGVTITSAGGKLTAVGGGAADGVLDGGSYTGGTLTLERSVGADVTVTGLTEPFDLHDDVTTSITAMAANDRLLISDEGAAGDPNVWINFRNLLNSLRGITSSNNATPQGVDRLFITDESESGDPVEYITIDALRTAIGGGGTADGVVDGGSVAGTTLTLTRTVGADIAITGLPSGGADPFDTAPIFTGNPSDPDRILIRDVSQGTTEYLSFLSFKGDVSPQLRDEGTQAGNAFDILNFTGDGVTCSQAGTLGTCNIPGGGGGGFEIHDLPQQTQQLATTDRIPLSDESASGDPNEYLTAFNFFSAIRDVVNTNRVTPLDNDRMYVTREDAAGDPLGYITVAQLQTRIGGGGGTTLSIAGLPNQASTGLADTDIMVIENVSESNVQRHLTMGSLADFLADGSTITATGGKLTAVGGGGGTTVAANPGGTYTNYLDDVTIGTTGYEVRGNPLTGRNQISVGNILSSGNRLFISATAVNLTPQYITMQTFRDEVITHQGPWVGNRGYNLGHVVYTGSGDSLTYWIASEAMPQGTDEPSFSSPGAWYHLGHRATYYGILEDPDQGFDFYEGSQFVWRDNLYIVTADSLDTDLATVIAGDNVIEITDPFRHVAELATTPADDDEILIYDTSEEVVTKRDYSDLKADLVGFNLHDDVTTFNSFPARSDRLLVNDESLAGDPNEYVTMSSLLNSFRDIINLEAYHNATPQDADRLFISDESQSADPVDYITVGELRVAVGSQQFANSLGTFSADTGAACGQNNAFVDTGVTVPTDSHMVSMWAWGDYNNNSGDSVHTIPYALFAALPVSAVGGNAIPNADAHNFSDRVAFRLALAANRAVYFGRSFDNNVLLAFSGDLDRHRRRHRSLSVPGLCELGGVTMPDPVVEGEPLQLGQVVGEGGFRVTPVALDGTRRVTELEFVDPGFTVYRHLPPASW